MESVGPMSPAAPVVSNEQLPGNPEAGAACCKQETALRSVEVAAAVEVEVEVGSPDTSGPHLRGVRKLAVRKSEAVSKDAAPRIQSPAACASPRAANLSRSLPASSGRKPRMRASVDAAAVWSLTFTSPKERSMGPATTSTSCIRPYGTTTRVRKSAP